MEWTQERRERLEEASRWTDRQGELLENVFVIQADLAAALSEIDRTRLYDDAIKRLADYADEIDRLTARVEALMTYCETLQAALRPWLPCPICNGTTECDHSVRERALAALTPPGEEPIVRDGNDAPADANPSREMESDVEAITRIIYDETLCDQDNPERQWEWAESLARAILAHLNTTKSEGEEPAQTNFERIMDGIRDAQTWADAQAQKETD